ncbi:hypothetical protein ACIGHJ_20445 [Stutzerimonas kunmingensis]|uniref:hypothetical protein n=1 Tax=Stutzerimonas stutzeri group TaxID=136846 RepID=UPI0012DA26C2|nr:hypothetical protein [Stutzerimonas frequens]
MDGWIVAAGIFAICVVSMSQCSTEKQEQNQLVIEQAKQDRIKRKEQKIKEGLIIRCERDRAMARYFLNGLSMNDDTDYSIFGHEAAQIKAQHHIDKQKRFERLTREANVSCN